MCFAFQWKHAILNWLILLLDLAAVTLESARFQSHINQSNPKHTNSKFLGIPRPLII